MLLHVLVAVPYKMRVLAHFVSFVSELITSSSSPASGRGLGLRADHLPEAERQAREKE